MKQKIIILILLVVVILIGKSEAAILTQKLGSEYIETTVEENEAVTMTFISKKGFRFKNWVLIEGDIEINTMSEEINFDMPSTDVTIEAEYDAAYEITFNSNDGTGTTASMTIIAESTEKLIANPFTREGYSFIGWSEEANGEVIYEDEEECTPTKNLVLYAIWEINEVTVEFNSNGGSAVSSITVVYGGNYGILPTPTKSGYTFVGWYKETGLENAVTSETEVTNTSSHTLYAGWRIPWNEPLVGSGMKRVNWNGSKWVDATEANWEYNYTIATAGTTTVEGDGTAMWANAVIDGDGNGTYESYYVWIPRFTYKVTEGNGYSWNADANTGTAKTEIIFSNGTVDDTVNGTYSKHSAFTLKDKDGNIVKELEGFWISKFEVHEGNNNKPLSEPSWGSWVSVSANDMFSYGKSLKSSLGSHMLKDSEWGAVAYLTSAVGRIPYINNHGDFINGHAGEHQDDDNIMYSRDGWNEYKSRAGVKASTTHNVYGVYDMSGCTEEYTAAYYSGSTSSDIANLESSYISDGTIYIDYYTIQEPIGACANLAWDSDHTQLLYDDSPIVRRGGNCSDNSRAGIFYFGTDLGLSETFYGFRLALWGCSL